MNRPIIPKADIYVPVKGLNKDFGDTIFSKEYLYNLINAKINRNEGSDLLTITSVKGTVLQAVNSEGKTVINGTVIGYSVIRQYLVVFAKGETMDYIYRFELQDDDTFTEKLLYSGNFNFSTEAPIEAVSNYESDDIIKTYWVDKNNNPRMINIVQEDNNNPVDYLPDNVDQFSFVRKLALNETFNVLKIDGGGRFHSGTIQYAFTYSVKNGVETNIFLTTGISFIAHTNRAGSKEEICECSFNITLDNLQHGVFDFLNVYAIERHDLNGTAVVRKLEPIVLTGTSVVVIDTGRGATVDSSSLLYLGGELLHVNTIDILDNHLFGGDVTLQRNHLKALANLIELEQGLPEADKSVSFEWVLADYVKNNPIVTIENEQVYSVDVKSEKYYDYEPLTLKYNTLGQNGVVRFFKPNETYRIGIQAQHETGNWSEVIYIGDYKVDKQIDVQYTVTKQNILLNRDTPLNNYYDRNSCDYTVKVPVPKITVKEQVTAILRDNGYLKVRLVYVPLTDSDRHIISQGILNSTIANTVSRANNRYFSYSDYFFRTKPINDAYFEQTLDKWVLTDNMHAFIFDVMNKSYLKRYVSKFLRPYHLDIISRVKSTDPYKYTHYGEIPYPIEYTANQLVVNEDGNANLRMYDVDESKTSMKNLWFVDGSIINGWSPEFTLDYYNTSNIKKINAIGFNGIITLDKSIQEYELFLNAKEYKYSNLILNPNFAGKTTIIDNPLNADVFNQPRYHSERERVANAFTSFIRSSLPYYFEEYYKYVYKNQHVNNLWNYDNDAPGQSVIDTIRYLFEDSSYVDDPDNALFLSEAFMKKQRYQLWGLVQNKEDLSRYQKYFRNLYFGRTYYFGSPIISRGYLMLPEINDYVKIDFDNNSIYEIDNKSYCYDVNELLAELTVDERKDTLSKLDITAGLLTYKNNSHLVFNLKPVLNSIGNGYTSNEAFAVEKAKLGIPNPLKTYVRKNEEESANDTVEFKFEFLTDNTSYADAVFTPYVAKLGNFNTNLNTRINAGEILSSAFLVDFMVDVQHQYGGNTPEVILSNQFIPCSNAVPVTSSEVIGQDGDTYYQRFDFIKTQPRDLMDKQTLTEAVSYLGCSFINLDGRYDKHRYDASVYAKHKGNYGLYNNAYSQLNNFFTYRILNYANLNDDSKGNSIIWSRQKYNQELTDKWLNLNLLSLHDLDGRYGKINKVINYNGALLSFQDRGIAHIIFNPRVQIPTSDGVPIEITNSGKLEGHRYLQTEMGCVNKWSIKSSGRALYFMDNLNKSIVRFTGEKFQNLSVEKGFATWSYFFLNNNKPFTPAYYDNFTTHVNLVTQEVYFNWLKVQEKNTTEFDFTNYTYLDSLDKWHDKWYFAGSLVFDEMADYFENEFDYDNVPYMFNVKDNFYGIKNNAVGNANKTFSIYRMNAGEYSQFFGKYCPIHVDYFVAPEYTSRKLFSNAHVTMDVFEPDDQFKHNIFFNELKVANQYQYADFPMVHVVNDIPHIHPNVRKKEMRWSIIFPRHHRTMQRFTNHWVRTKYKFNYPDKNYRIRLYEVINFYNSLN